MYLQVCSLQEAEAKIGCGQIEEVIIQAENELVLSRSILEWKVTSPITIVLPDKSPITIMKPDT